MEKMVPNDDPRPLRRLYAALVALVICLSAALLPVAAARAAQLVMFDSEYCPWCTRWKREIGVVYMKTEEGARAPLRIVDKDAPRPADLRHIRGIYWTPTFVLLDDDGREVGRIEGYQNEDAFWALLDALLKKLDSRKEKGASHLSRG